MLSWLKSVVQKWSAAPPERPQPSRPSRPSRPVSRGFNKKVQALPTDVQEQILKSLRPALLPKDIAALRTMNRTFASALGPDTPPARPRVYYTTIYDAFESVCEMLEDFVRESRGGVRSADVYLEWTSPKKKTHVVFHANALAKFPLRIGIVVNKVTQKLVKHGNVKELRKDFVTLARTVHPAGPADFKVVVVVQEVRHRTPREVAVTPAAARPASAPFAEVVSAPLSAALDRLVKSCAAA